MNTGHSGACLCSNRSPTSSRKPLLVNHSMILLTVDWLVIERRHCLTVPCFFTAVFIMHTLSLLTNPTSMEFWLAPHLAQAWVQISLYPLLVHIVVFNHCFGENCSDTALNAIQTNLIS